MKNGREQFYTNPLRKVNEGTTIYPRALFCLLLGQLFHLSLALAIPPEGLEAFAILSHDAHYSKIIYAFGGYTHPAYTNDYQLLNLYTSQPVGNKNYLSYGLNLTAGNNFGDRDAYFVRYDQTFYGQSISFKVTHIDYRYLSAAKNILSLDYNTGFRIGKESEFYLSLGAYYRFSLNPWNNQTWSPLNFNTDDRELFVELCFGTKLGLGKIDYMTADLNNRDTFNSYNGDDLAFDLTFNFPNTKNFIWRIVSSTRFSGALGGNADIGEQGFQVGFITSL